MNASRDLLDPIDDVVEGGREIADVFTVDRGDERTIEGSEDLMGDLVARVLDVLQVARLALHVDKVDE